MSQKKDTIIGLQILRAVAAFVVAYLHSTGRGGVNLLPHTGGFGVDIFFVISGFVITFMTTLNTERFFIKRIVRIVPLYIIGTLDMSLACIIFPEKINHTVSTIPAFFKSILFIPYKITTDLEPSGPILEQGWSLNFEILFYVVVSAFVIFVKNKRLVGVLSAIFLTIVFFVIPTFAETTDFFMYNYYITYQGGMMPEFIFGILIFYLYDFLKSKNRGYLLIKNSFLNSTVFGLLSLSSLIFLLGDNIYLWHSSTYRYIFWGLPSVLLVFSFLNLERHLKETKFVRFLMKVGDSSYALYLFHTFIIMFFTRILLVDIISENDNIYVSILLAIVILSVTVLVSILIFNLIDNPIQKFLRKFISKKSKTKQCL